MTLKNVAEKAGVSQAAVSRVLKRDRTFSVSEETRQKILNAAEELGYRSKSETGQAAADELSKGRVGIFLLYEELSEIKDRYYQIIRLNAKNELEKNGFSTAEFFRETVDKGIEEIDSLQGVILVGHPGNWFRMEELRAMLQSTGIPVVCADFQLSEEELNADYVINDFKSIVRKALECFERNGYEEIGYIGTYGIEISGVLQEDDRYRYFRRMTEEKGCFREEFVWLSDNSYIEHGYELGQRILKEKQKIPRAVFAETDNMAIGFLRALKEAGVSVPGEVAIIGCNDIQTASFVTPPLTSVRIYDHMIGIMSARLLADRIMAKRDESVKLIVANKLIVRESCPEGII